MDIVAIVLALLAMLSQDPAPAAPAPTVPISAPAPTTPAPAVLHVSPSCMTVTIDWSDGSPRLASSTGRVDGMIRADIVGRFLWVQTGHLDDSNDTEDIISYELTSDITTVDLCVDA